MKKILLFIICVFCLPITVNAANAAINLQASDTNILEGESFNLNVNITSSSNLGYYEYTLDYDNSKLKLVRGTNYNVNRANDSSTKKFTNTFKFTALDSGTSVISVKSYAVLDFKDKNLDVSVKPATIKVSKSNNNTNTGSLNLSALEIEGYDISPKFTPSTTKYKLTIKDNISQINVLAESEDPHAVLKGTGKISLDEKENEVKIIVSNNGKSKTYTINVILDKSSNLSVNVDNTSYFLLKDASNLEIPKGFKEKELTIDDEKIIGLYNENLDITLVGLIDEDDNINLYIYNVDSNTFTPYIELTFNTISFFPLSEKDVPSNYSKYTVTIDNTDISCYKLTSDSKFCLVYGVNTETGDEGWYSYNEDEGTIQKYNLDIDTFYENKIQNTQILIYILAGTTLLFGVVVIILTVRFNQRKMKNKSLN